MTALAIQLHRNLYSANAWNTAHVEGKIEWPPSPWRIYRAILAGHYLAIQTGEDLNKALVDQAILQLAGTLPHYYLPRGSYLQTRSYRKDKSGDTNLLKNGKQQIDAEYRFSNSDRTIFVQWNVDLPEDQRQAIARCLPYLRYIGRREAEADWNLVADDSMPEANAYPGDGLSTLTLAPETDCGQDLIHSLETSADTLHRKQKRYYPEHSCWVSYIVKPNSSIQLQEPVPDADYVRYRVEVESPIPKKLALKWVDKLHQSLVQGCTSKTFTGCDEMGNPLQSHAHVYMYPEVDERDRVTHFCLYSPCGFTNDEIDAITRVRLLYGKQKEGNVRLRLAALGTARQYLSSATRLESATPFYLSRYPKRSRSGKPKYIPGTFFQRDGAAHQALTQLLYLPQFQSLRSAKQSWKQEGDRLQLLLDGKLFASCRAMKWERYWEWLTVRKELVPKSPVGFKLDISLTQPLLAPIAIGWGSHYGLGLMREGEGVEEQILSNSLVA